MKIEIVVTDAPNNSKIVKEIMEILYGKYHGEGFEFQYSHHNRDKDDGGQPLHYGRMEFNKKETL